MKNEVQIKNNLIARIRNSKDMNLILAIQTIFDSSEQSLFELNDQQHNSIELGRKNMINGDYKEHGQVMDEMKEWLARK
jgi:hypothetical protein